MKDTTRCVKEDCKILRGIINQKSNNAIKKNNVRIWIDSFNSIYKRLVALIDICETQNAKKHVYNTIEICSRRNTDIINFFTNNGGINNGN